MIGNPFRKIEAPAPVRIEEEAQPEQRVEAIPEEEDLALLIERAEQPPTLMGHRWLARLTQAGAIPEGVTYNYEDLQQQMTTEEARLFFKKAWGGRQKLPAPEVAVQQALSREKALNPTIENCVSIHDLYDVLDFMGEVQGSEQAYPAEDQKKEINMLVKFIESGMLKSQRDIEQSVMLGKITRTGGLRAKVLELAVQLLE